MQEKGVLIKQSTRNVLTATQYTIIYRIYRRMYMYVYIFYCRIYRVKKVQNMIRNT